MTEEIEVAGVVEDSEVDEDISLMFVSPIAAEFENTGVK
jgi:hypothetical protein